MPGDPSPSARIHILGASASGTTTLGRALAEEWGLAHFDTDDFFWVPSVPAYQTARSKEERLRLLGEALDGVPSWVSSGSLCGWGDPLIPRFTLVVFLAIPPAVRLARLEARERERYAAADLLPGGVRYEAYRKFVEWAAAYDEGDLTVRSRRLHEVWLAELPCPVLRLEGDLSTAERLAGVRAFLRS